MHTGRITQHGKQRVKHFGRFVGIIYLFLTFSKTDGTVSSQQAGAFPGSFPADVSLDITGKCGCGHRGKFVTSEEGGGKWGKIS